MDKMINVALPKGRLGDKAYAYLEKSGYPFRLLHLFP